VKRRIAILSVLCLALIFTSCTVTVTTPETKINIENTMEDLDIITGGITYRIDYIDVKDVSIGDVDFTSTIQAGTISDAKVTSRSGHVDVLIGTATAKSTSVTFTFNNITLESVNILAGVTNTVIFDDITAGLIFAHVGTAKKKVN
jgi:hypothetical protein